MVKGNGDVRAVKFVLDPSYPQGILDREVSSLNRVRHASVVVLHAYSSVVVNSLPVRTLEFEYVEGGDVQGHMSSGSWPSPRDCLQFTCRVLAGVSAVHGTNTVHRDIKPSNIALRNGNWSSPVLLDFGLAKQLSTETLTRYPAVKGTYPFMSPEQLRGEPARRQADVWAIGVLAHILLTQQHPFLDGPAQPIAPSDLLDRMESGPRPLPSGLPPNFASVVRRLLNYDGYARGSASRAHQELMEVLDDQQSW